MTALRMSTISHFDQWGYLHDDPVNMKQSFWKTLVQQIFKPIHLDHDVEGVNVHSSIWPAPCGKNSRFFWFILDKKKNIY